jgi:manganese oxidase
MMKRQRISRRMFLGGGIGVAGLASNVLALSTGPQGKPNIAYASSHISDQSNSSLSDMAGMAGMAGMAAGAVPGLPYLLKDVNPTVNGGFNPSTFIQQFEQGTVQTIAGKQTRVFNLVSIERNITVAIDNVTGKPMQFPAWAIGTSEATAQVPGPTLRCTQGENILINYKNNSTAFTHSIHFHGIHNTGNDGSLIAAAPGQSVKYEFIADPPGMMAYHCHVFPGLQHIGKGLYGAMIIDPPNGRSPMAELVLVMNAFPIGNGNKNTVYAFNTIANHYGRNQIAIPLGQAIRIYLVNMVFGDPPISFHLHANFFNAYPSGTKDTPTQFNDMITLAMLERYVLEFTFDAKRFTPGSYMFHSHDDPGELGMFGMFLFTNGAI